MGDEAVVECARRLVVRHAAVEVAAIVAVYGVAVHLDEAPVSLRQGLALQVGFPLRIQVARRLAALRGFILLGPGGIVAFASGCVARSSRVPLLLCRRLVPLGGRRAAGSWSRRLRRPLPVFRASGSAAAAASRGRRLGTRRRRRRRGGWFLSRARRRWRRRGRVRAWFLRLALRRRFRRGRGRRCSVLGREDRSFLFRQRRWRVVHAPRRAAVDGADAPRCTAFACRGAGRTLAIWAARAASSAAVRPRAGGASASSPARIVGGVVVAIVSASERYRSSFSVVLGGRVGKIADIFPRCPIWTGRNGLEGL